MILLGQGYYPDERVYRVRARLDGARGGAGRRRRVAAGAPGVGGGARRAVRGLLEARPPVGPERFSSELRSSLLRASSLDQVGLLRAVDRRRLRWEAERVGRRRAPWLEELRPGSRLLFSDSGEAPPPLTDEMRELLAARPGCLEAAYWAALGRADEVQATLPTGVGSALDESDLWGFGGGLTDAGRVALLLAWEVGRRSEISIEDLLYGVVHADAVMGAAGGALEGLRGLSWFPVTALLRRCPVACLLRSTTERLALSPGVEWVLDVARERGRCGTVELLRGLCDAREPWSSLGVDRERLRAALAS